MKKMLLLMLFSLMMTLQVSAAGQQEEAVSEDQVVLKIYAQYSSDDEKMPYDYAAAALAEAMPNVTLELDIRGQDDDVRLRTYAAAGNLPDIFQTNANLIGQFQESGFVAQLDVYVKSQI